MVSSPISPPTARHSGQLDRLVTYFSALSTGLCYRLERNGNRCRLFADLRRPCVSRQVEEFALAVVIQFARQQCGGSFQVEQVSLRSPEPPRLDEHLELFSVTPRFRRRASYADFCRALLELPLASANGELAKLLEPAAKAVSTPTVADVEGRVLGCIADALAAGRRPLASEVARELGMSPRTLRRHLAESHSSFRALSDRSLARIAHRLLEDTELSLDEVAARLQFSDLRALSSATRRWFGVTPQQYRQVLSSRLMTI